MQIPAYIQLPSGALDAPAPSGGVPLVARLAMRLRRWVEIRRTATELAMLDDATLRDIGVTRSQLRLTRDDPRWGW